MKLILKEDIRKHTRAFSKDMQRKLLKNAHKNCPSIGDEWCLLERIKEETKELKKALSRAGRDVPSATNRKFLQAIIDESADLANFAMMIATLAHESIDSLTHYQK